MKEVDRGMRGQNAIGHQAGLSEQVGEQRLAGLKKSRGSLFRDNHGGRSDKALPLFIRQLVDNVGLFSTNNRSLPQTGESPSGQSLIRP